MTKAQVQLQVRRLEVIRDSEKDPVQLGRISYVLRDLREMEERCP